MKVLKALSKPVVKEEKPVASPEAMEQMIVDLVDDQLSKRNTPYFKQMGYFRPSQTNQCARFWHYMFEGIEMQNSFSAQTYRIFDNGHAVHDRLYGYFRECGILVAEEIPVQCDDPPIQGTADGIIDIHGHKLIELKSISMEGFAYRDLNKKPTDDHYRQAQIYMHCLDLDSGFVIYENKNNQRILPIYIERDQVFIDKLFKKYRKIHEDFQKGLKPDRPYKRTSKHCASCDLVNQCWSDSEGVKAEDPF